MSRKEELISIGPEDHCLELEAEEDCILQVIQAGNVRALTWAGVMAGCMTTFGFRPHAKVVYDVLVKQGFSRTMSSTRCYWEIK